MSHLNNILYLEEYIRYITFFFFQFGRKRHYTPTAQHFLSVSPSIHTSFILSVSVDWRNKRGMKTKTKRVLISRGLVTLQEV